MDREFGAAEAAALVKKNDFPPSSVAFCFLRLNRSSSKTSVGTPSLSNARRIRQGSWSRSRE